MVFSVHDMVRLHHRFFNPSSGEERETEKKRESSQEPQNHSSSSTIKNTNKPDINNVIIQVDIDTSVPIVQQMAATESEAFILSYLSQFQKFFTNGNPEQTTDGESVFTPFLQQGDFIDPLDIDKQDVSDDDPTHIESSLLRQSEAKYKDLLYKKELQLLREKKLQDEEEEYERRLAEQLEQSKILSAQKKKAKERLIGFWLGVLFGDMGGELFGNMVVPFAPCPPAFLKIFTPNMTTVNPVEAIEPIKLLRGWSPHYIKQREHIIPTIFRWINKIFAGLYRAWLEQNPFIKCEYHQRGPPCRI